MPANKKLASSSGDKRLISTIRMLKRSKDAPDSYQVLADSLCFMLAYAQTRTKSRARDELAKKTRVYTRNFHTGKVDPAKVIQFAETWIDNYIPRNS